MNRENEQTGDLHFSDVIFRPRRDSYVRVPL